MKLKLLLLIGVAAMTFAGSGPSAAADGPWCLRVVTDGQSLDQCEYRTFEACSEQRLSDGNKSHCYRNPAYPSDQSDKRSGKAKRS